MRVSRLDPGFPVGNSRLFRGGGDCRVSRSLVLFHSSCVKMVFNDCTVFVFLLNENTFQIIIVRNLLSWLLGISVSGGGRGCWGWVWWVLGDGL